ncbi:Metallo-hydrolase/oxidoreductase [Ramaria rubella]|nr:Metallo-hydrolase/oxidoreductase [Ramaria rubella]
MAQPVDITIDPDKLLSPLRDEGGVPKESLPDAKEIKVHPNSAKRGHENASIFFVGTATTVLEWAGMRLMTDPNFLHAGDHVHLGPMANGTRLTNPAVDLHDLPRIDLVLLSHYHADHFDQLVEESLRRDLPIVTTPHAHDALTKKLKPPQRFTAVTPLKVWDSALVHIRPSSLTNASETHKCIRITATPGKHMPMGPLRALEVANKVISAIPPTNGYIVELGEEKEGKMDVGYRIYISGDTLFVNDLKEIPKRYPDIDLMLIHLGGTMLPMIKLMVTMDAKQGIRLVQLIQPELTIPIHNDDYDVFKSPLSDFVKQMSDAGLAEKLVTLDRGDQYSFQVRDANNS